MRRTRTNRARRRRRVLLVGLPPLQLDALGPALADVADIESVPFPGAAFEEAAVESSYDLVVVDVTYLDEGRVRPLIHRHFAGHPAVAYVSATGPTRLHDLSKGESWELEEPSVPGLVALASGRARVQVAAKDGAYDSRPIGAVGSTEGGRGPEKGAEMLEYLKLQLARLQGDETGQAMVEYALILGLVSVVSIVILGTIGGQVNGIFTAISGALAGVPGA
jgi:pilus assembly protein Flp/PilA